MVKFGVVTNQAMPPSVAWHCRNCGRLEDHAKHECPQCGAKRTRVSRYEWFLADALQQALTVLDRKFEIREQLPMGDHRGFTWYWDLAVRVWTTDQHHKHTVLVEVNGKDHDRQAVYSGPGGGYTRDYDKEWEFYNVQHLDRAGYSLHTVRNEDCKQKIVKATAWDLASLCADRADSW